jgi:hypothetical protein
MSIQMRGEDGKIHYIGMSINCEECRFNRGEDGIIESIDCVSETVKPECKECSLINAVKPQRKGIDPKN